ncbi:MAG: IS200/IS605 family accessory protein TnpB-related protein, partial [Promethearchaeota archaeon]
DYCIKNNIGTIIAGKNKFWKQKVNLGKILNRKFVGIPFNMLYNFLRYKSELVGINFLVQSEGYTSKCSLIDEEEVRKHKDYAGKRAQPFLIPFYYQWQVPLKIIRYAKITLDDKDIFWKKVTPRGLFESGKVNKKTKKHYLINSDCNGAGNIIRSAWSKGREIKKSDITPLNIYIESDLEKLKNNFLTETSKNPVKNKKLTEVFLNWVKNYTKKFNRSKSTIINKKLFKTFGQMDEEPFTQMNNPQINKLLQRPQIIKVC